MTRRLRALLVALVGSALLALGAWALLRGHDTLAFTVGSHAVELLSPRALYVVCAVPFVFAALSASLVDLSRKQQALSAVARALLLLLVALALARPSTVTERRTVATVILVDVSDSIGARQLEAARALVDQARKARSGDAILKLVTFAKHPRLEPLPPADRPDEPLQPVDSWRHAGEGDATDLESALDLAYGLYPPDTIDRALLVTDGNETTGNLAAQAVTAHERGVKLDVQSFAAEQDDEVLVRALTVPSDVKVGAPFEVTAELYASRAQPATVTLFRDEFVNPHDGRRPVELTAGKNVLHWKSEVVNPGFTTFKVVVSGGAGQKLRDHFPANNQAVASVAVKGNPRVLYVEGEPQSASYLANALKKENIDVEVRGPYGLPTLSRELERYDLVIVSDVPSLYVGPAQADALEKYVRDLGGSFLMAGGENSFGSGGYQGSRIETLLPVRFDVEKKRDQPNLAVALAMDRSGSMQQDNRIELAKDAAKATAELLGPDDLISVIVFDTRAEPIVRLQRAANRTRILGLISSVLPGGGTNIFPALKEAFEELDPAAAKLKHVILLTDGQASYDGIRELVDEMAEHKITVSAVGVGPEADKTLLTMVAEHGGGRFYHTLDPQNVPRIFTKELKQVARSALVEQAVAVRVAKRAELLSGVDIASAPPLRGYVVVKPKPLSEVILESTLAEPILARWRVGLGQSVAFTSDVKNRWAVDWLKWPGYGKLWAQIVRATMRHNTGAGAGGAQLAGASFDLRVDVDAPRAHVAVDAISGEDKFLSGLDCKLQVIDPEHPQKPVELALQQTAAGRYEGDFTLDRYGTFNLRAVLQRNGTELGESTGTVSLPYPREYLALPPDEALLARVAQLTGGRVRPEPAQLFAPGSARVPWHRELWAWPLWAAACLLLVDVLLRRVRVFA